MNKRKATTGGRGRGRSKRMNNSQGGDNEQIMNDNNYDHRSFVLGKMFNGVAFNNTISN
jgi:hypothetical protein